MDVAPENKDGRTMLPFRWVVQAFGATVDGMPQLKLNHAQTDTESEKRGASP